MLTVAAIPFLVRMNENENYSIFPFQTRLQYIVIIVQFAHYFPIIISSTTIFIYKYVGRDAKVNTIR